MMTHLPEIPSEYWDTYEIARTEQLVYFGWNSRKALEFAQTEVAARKKIEEEWGAQYAIFAVLKRPEFPLAVKDSYFLRPLTERPFDHVVDDGL